MVLCCYDVRCGRDAHGVYMIGEGMQEGNALIEVLSGLKREDFDLSENQWFYSILGPP